MARSHSWLSLALDSWSMSVNASAVVALRMAKLAAGGAEATAEAQLMVGEKIAAALELQTLAAMGGLGRTASSAGAGLLRHYGGKVRANRRRLSRRKR